jgi:FHS family Na+ dependent glucose MFS transporter 1
MSRNHTAAMATATCFASYVLFGVFGGAVGPTLGPFAAQVGVGLSTIGVMLTTRSLGYLIGALASTRWIDRTRIPRGLAAAALLTAGGLAALPWARSFAFLVALGAPLGFATAGLDVGMSTILVRSHSDRAAPVISAQHFFYGVGALAAPFFVAAFSAGHETLIYPILAVGFVLLALVSFLLPAVPARGISVEPSSPNRLGGELPAATPTAGSTPLGRRFLTAMSVILIHVGAEMVFASWLYVFVDLQFGAALATSVTGAFWAAFTLSRLGAVFAARRLAPERSLAVAFAGGLAFALLLVFLPHARLAVWIGAVGVGAAVGPVYPNIITAYSHRHELTGKRFGAIAVASCTGSMIFPWLAGRLLDVGGPVVVPAGTALLLAGAAAAAFGSFRRPRGATPAPAG